jgi:hypothetical protein
MGILENNVIKALEPIVKNLDNPRIKALSKYLELTKEEEKEIYYESYDIYCYGNQEYMVLTDDEAVIPMARKLERATFGSLFFLSMAKNCSLAAALVGVRTSQLFGYATREKALRCLPVYPVQPRDHNCSLLRCCR